MLSKILNTNLARQVGLWSALSAVALVVVWFLASESLFADTTDTALFDSPPVPSDSVSQATGSQATVTQSTGLCQLPPVCNSCQPDCNPCPPDCRRNSLLPRSLHAPEETALIRLPQIDRPLVSPPFLPRGKKCEPGPFATPPPAAPGYMRGPTRYGIVSPVPPAMVSAHAPPWEQMPTPAEHPGAIVKLAPVVSDPCSCKSGYYSGDFTPDPMYCEDWDACAEMDVYGGKYTNKVQRPALEWGIPFYQNGPLPTSLDFLGSTNLVQPKFYLYGDFRTAVAQNKNVGDETTIWASRLNLEFDFWLTATERFHMFWGPMDKRNQFTSVTSEGGQLTYNDFWDGWDERTDTMFFEGDLGYILGGLTNQYANFDLPFAVGLIPLLFQNGIWMEDAFVGAAVTIPARNNPVLDWSNFDTTLFVGFDEITNNRAFAGDNDAANMVGFTTFIDRRGGYIEFGYAFVEDSRDLGRSFHSVGASYTRRYLNLLSNSVRVLVNTGQGGPQDQRSADGVLFLLENSFLTRNPYNVIPYANFFAGYGTPRPVARLEGPLKNTGINFETDLLTGFPLLDDTGNNTYGGAIGIDLLGQSFEKQLILEFAFLQAYDDPSSRAAAGDQYAVGARYQRPLNNSLLLRADVMHGWLENSDDIFGGRIELRRKF